MSPTFSPDSTRHSRPPSWRGWFRRFAGTILILLLGPFAMLAFGGLDLKTHWSQASLASTGQAPDPSTTPEPLVLVYGARAHNWRGAFAIHTWIATKRAQAAHYTLHQVLGWNLAWGQSVVSTRQGVPDARWYNAMPELLLERRGPTVEALIDRIEAVVAAYPYPRDYHVWPGPNSNTFTAFVARQVPELGLDLPPTALGKDYLTDCCFLAPTPSGTGWQVSLAGLLGLSLAREEGIELNVLGLAVGVDLNDLSLRLPGIGRVRLVERG